MKAAESNKVKRADFMAQHFGKEQPNWVEMILVYQGTIGKSLRDPGRRNTYHSGGLSSIAEDSGLPIPEFRRVVQTVQKGEREAGKKRNGRSKLKARHIYS